MKLNYTTCSMTGGKRLNEDSIYAKLYENSDKGVFVVCDGMGGLNKGNEASQTVIAAFTSIWDKHHSEWSTEQMLQEAVLQGKNDIDRLSKYDIGTTMVMAATDGKTITIAHLGDSRAYYVRNGKGVIYQTEDHITIGQEGWPYVSKGFFNFKDVDTPTIKRFHAQKGDRILLCSDGVYGCYRGNALIDLLMETNLSTTMSSIVEYCNEHATDNYSAILIEIL